MPQVVLFSFSKNYAKISQYADTVDTPIMTSFITQESLEDLFIQAELNGQAGWQYTETDEIYWMNLPDVSQSYECHTDLQDGLSIVSVRDRIMQNLQGVTPEEETSGDIGLTFFLSGKVQTQFHGLTEVYEELIGHYNFHAYEGLAETEQWLAVQPFSRLYIDFDPVQLFSGWHTDQWSHLPVEIQQILEGENHPFILHSVITPEMHQVIQQILHCPYIGAFKLLYLQGKARELITLALQPFLPKAIVSTRTLKSADIELVHHAKNLFVAQLDRPPSMAELSKQVGLNEFSLGQKFKQVFGTTLFRYLHDHRLEVARQLLSDRSLRIEEISRRVGFANRSYFAAEFRKKFGVSPKNYRRQ